jgi:hypothetical protein
MGIRHSIEFTPCAEQRPQLLVAFPYALLAALAAICYPELGNSAPQVVPTRSGLKRFPTCFPTLVQA